MFKKYIDKKIKEIFTQNEERIKREAEKVANRTVNSIIRDIINRPYNCPVFDEMSRFIGNEIRSRFKGELENLSERRRNVNELENSLSDVVKKEAEKYVQSEDFIDELVYRIKRKQI